MFIGHFAVGFAAKKFAPRTSMGALLAAPLFLDLLWPVFLLLGLEQVRIDPGNTRYGPGAAAIWIGVVSQWVLDWVSHRPDMPLYPGGPKCGLGLWNSIAGTMVVELGMMAVGVWLYVRTTRASDRIGRYALVSYVGLLLVLYIGDRFSGPPPSVGAIAWTGIAASVVLVPWAWWFDRHREVVPVASR